MRNRYQTLVCCLVLLVACRGRDRGPDIGALVADLKGADAEKKGKATLALIRVGEPAVPALVEMLRSEEPRHRAMAATTFFGMGAKAKAASPALADSLSDPEVEVRVGAAMALESIGPDAASAVPALIQALKDKDGLVRQRAAIALGKIGPAARQAVPALAEAAKWDPVRPAAEEAIQRIQAR